MLSLNKMLKRLVAAVRTIYGKKEYRLHIYQGVIRPDVIDTNEANILGQALNNIPDQIQLVDEIKLDPKNNILSTIPPNSEIRDEIKPIFKTVQNYLRYFFNDLTIKEKEVKNANPDI
jgi:hypothetical protein